MTQDLMTRLTLRTLMRSFTFANACGHTWVWVQRGRGQTAWACQTSRHGWKCGRCGRGLMKAKVRHRCRVCGARVRKVVSVVFPQARIGSVMRIRTPARYVTAPEGGSHSYTSVNGELVQNYREDPKSW